MKKTRVAILNSHPIQYFVPLYQKLSSYDDIDLDVFYFSDASVRGAHDPGFGRSIKWDLDLLSGYKYHFVGRHYHTVVPVGFFSLPLMSTVAAVWRGRYDVIVLHGYQFLAYMAVLLAAKLQGAAVLLRADTHSLQMRQKNQHGLKRWMKSRLLSVFDGMLTIGSANRDYYLSMGVDPRRLFLAPFAIDNERFRRDSDLEPSKRAELRRSMGLDPSLPTAIYMSKFSKRKGPDYVIRAASLLASEGVRLQLVMAGSGEMEDELKQLASQQSGLHVCFPGFVNQTDIPRLLGACDFFVFPTSDEPWGLIVNEAIACGLPVIVGREAGCVRDIVHDSRNGFLIDASSMEELVSAMRKLATGRTLRKQMAAEGLKIINEWGYEQCCAGYRRAFGLRANQGTPLHP